MQMSNRGDKKVNFCKYTDIVIWNGIKLYLAVSTLAENEGNHHRTSRHDTLNLVQAFSQSLNTPINGKVHDNQHFQVFIVLCTLTKLFMCVWAYYPAAVWIILHKDAKMQEACRSRMECFFFVRVHSFWWCYPTVFDTPWAFQILYLEWSMYRNADTVVSLVCMLYIHLVQLPQCFWVRCSLETWQSQLGNH